MMFWDSLFEIPEGAAEPQRHNELCHTYHHGTHIETVGVDRDVVAHKVEDEDGYDEALHDRIGDHAQHRDQLLVEVDAEG